MNCDVNFLSQASSCIRCLPDGLLLASKTSLLCSWANNANSSHSPPSANAWTWTDIGGGVAQASLVSGCPTGADGWDLGAVASPGDPTVNIVSTNNACGATSSKAFTTGDTIALASIRWKAGGVAISPWSAVKSVVINAFPVTSGLILRNESYDFDGIANGTALTAWNDKSGGAHHWAQGATAPTADTAITANGHTTAKIIFTTPNTTSFGQASYFGAGGFTGLEVIAIYRHAADPPNDPQGVGACFQFTQQDNAASHQPYADQHYYENFGRTVRQDLGLSGINSAAAFVCLNVTCKADGTLYDAYMNSTNFFHAVAGYTFNQQGVHDAADGYHLGFSQFYGFSTYFFTGNIAAVYVWNRSLSVAERMQMRTYITNVYGVAFP